MVPHTYFEIYPQKPQNHKTKAHVPIVKKEGGVPPSGWWGRGHFPVPSWLGEGGYSIFPDGRIPPFQVRIGGYSHSGSGRGYPHPRSGLGVPLSQVRTGGTPPFQVKTGVPPSKVRRGDTPSPDHYRGYPSPHPGQVPGQDGVPPTGTPQWVFDFIVSYWIL